MIQKFKKTEHKYELNVNQLNNMKNIYINVFKIGKQRKKSKSFMMMKKLLEKVFFSIRIILGKID